jgi:broad specificity phosphatase PhoE
MMEIILVRHGQTEWNTGRVYRGRADVGLDEVGMKQAELLGGYLAELKLDAVYSSPLRRALDTAVAVAQHQAIDVQVSDGLIDFDYGKWQGLSDEEVRKSYPALRRRWCTAPHLVTMPRGESLRDVKKRALAVVDEAVRGYDGHVVLVSHRVVNKVLICSLLGLGNSHFWDIRQDVGGMTTFDYVESRFVLTGHNDTSYLVGVRTPVDDF